MLRSLVDCKPSKLHRQAQVNIYLIQTLYSLIKRIKVTLNAAGACFYIIMSIIIRMQPLMRIIL